MIRVFISSTFRDMNAERDYLTRIVFPELRSRCLARGVEFAGLDLRWGVTREETRERGALAICLDEIETCRPFFVCLLGDRYGWVPPLEVVAQEDYERIRDSGGLADSIADWYRLDTTSEPPVYRLRRDEELPAGMDQILAAFWEHHGLEEAGHSITAREILRGAFEEGYPKTHSLFFLRASGIEQHKHFPQAFVQDFIETDSDRRSKLKALKQQIELHADSIVVGKYEAPYFGLKIDPALLPQDLSAEEQAVLADGVIEPDEWVHLSKEVKTAFETYGTVMLAGMEALGDQILENLWRAIQVEIEAETKPLDEHQRQRAYHERFVVDRTRLFIGRHDLINRAMMYIGGKDDGEPFVIHGAPGSGKSALMAKIAMLAREKYPEALIVPHFIGTAPGSNDLNTTLHSICEEIRRGCDLEEEVPLGADKLRVQLPVSLRKGGEKRRVVLLLDAVNQLDPGGNSHNLGWFPFQLPPGVKIIVSTLQGEVLDRLEATVGDDHRFRVLELMEADRKVLVKKHLGARSRRLSDEQLESLLDVKRRPASGLPLYLLVALEELLLFGDYDALEDRISALPETLPELFGQVLGRLEHDHGRDITESVCRWLAVSRSGLTEPEILDLLNERWPDLATVRWTRLFRSLEFYLRPVEQENLLDFYHDQLRFAVLERYFGMASPGAGPTDEWRDTNRELGKYYRSICCLEGDYPRWHPDRYPDAALPPLEPQTPVAEGRRSARGLSELPYHLTRAEAFEDLHAVLTDLGFLEAKCTHVNVIFKSTNDGGREEKLYAGIYALQEDCHRVLEKLPHQVRPMQRELLEELSGFLVAEGPVLFRWPELMGQQVANQPRSSGMATLTDQLEALQDRSARPWLRWINRPDVPDPGPLLTIPAHSGEISSITFTSDGNRIVSTSLDGTAVIWEARGGREVTRFGGVRQTMANYNWAPTTVALTCTGGGRIALAKADGSVTVHRDEDGAEEARLQFESDEVGELALSADGTRLAVNSTTGISVWDIVTRGAPHDPRGLDIQRRGARHDPRGLECMGEWEGSGPIGFCSDPNLLYYNSWPRLRDLKLACDRPVQWLEIQNLPEEVQWKFWDGGVCLTSNPSRFTPPSGDWNLGLRPVIYEVEKGEMSTSLPSSGSVPLASKDGRILVIVDLSTIYIVDLTINEIIAVLSGTHDWDPASVWISPDATLLLVSGKHGELEAWDLRSGGLLHDMDTKPYKIRNLAFHPDHKHAVFCSWSPFDPYFGVRVLDLVDGKLRGVLAAHAAEVTALSFSEDGGLLASGDVDGQIVIWDYLRAPIVSDAQVLPRKVTALEVGEGGQRLWYRVEAEEWQFPEEIIECMREEAGLGWHCLDTSTGRELPCERSFSNNVVPLWPDRSALKRDHVGLEGPLWIEFPGFGTVQFQYDPLAGAVTLSDVLSDDTIVRFVLPERPAQIDFVGDLLVIGGAAKGRVYVLQAVPGIKIVDR